MTRLRHNVLLGPLLLLMSRYLAQVVTPIVGLLVVRYLGAQQFGLYAAATAVTSLVGVLTDLGLQQAMLQLGARHPKNLGSILWSALALGMLLAGLATGVVVGWFFVFPYALEARVLALILTFGFFQGRVLATLTAGMQVKGLYGRLSSWNLATSGAQWAGTLLAMALRMNLYVVVAAPLALSGLITLAMLVVEGRGMGLFARQQERIGLGALWSAAWQFGIANVMYQGYAQAQAAILSVFRTPLEVGYYSVGNRLVGFPNTLPGIVFNQVLYPKYFAWSAGDRTRLQVYYQMMTKVMLLEGALATCLIELFGVEAITLVYGTTQPEAVRMMVILALGIPLFFFTASPGALLVTDGHIAAKIPAQGLVALISVGLNVALIPRWGAMAPAWLSVLSYAMLGVAYSVTLSRRCELTLRHDILRQGITWAFMLVSVVTSVSTRTLSLLVRMEIMAGISMAALVVFWYVLTAQEWQEIKSLWHRGQPVHATAER